MNFRLKPRGRGERLSPEEHRGLERAIMRAVQAGPTISNEELGRRFGCSGHTIEGHRRRLADQGTIPATAGTGGRQRVFTGRPSARRNVASRTDMWDEDLGHPGPQRIAVEPGPGVVQVTVQVRYGVPGKPYGYEWYIPFDLSPGDLLDASRGADELPRAIANNVRQTLKSWLWPDPFRDDEWPWSADTTT